MRACAALFVFAKNTEFSVETLALPYDDWKGSYFQAIFGGDAMSHSDQDDATNQVTFLPSFRP